MERYIKTGETTISQHSRTIARNTSPNNLFAQIENSKPSILSEYHGSFSCVGVQVDNSDESKKYATSI